MSELHFEQAPLPSGWSRDVSVSIVGDGIFDAPSYCGSGGRFGVGSDSNVLIGVADELRQLEFSQRLALRAQYHGDATNRVDRWHDGAGRPVRRRRP